ncbi:pyrroline-5-carboxylate reductase [Naasia lichenicola]|uniref:Pyrroline-5-carboxylate reductase n=1 Tax=Naasia lichenicola TaxID=2565933 RepID=A0A4S4FKZ6_9MICO|nr:pyrroline-5-carboxylate reductase [Naasia lichenicola]THG31070.1 pyrroline-5-carboxylate reductase [Naasia lichenicola]
MSASPTDGRPVDLPVIAILGAGSMGGAIARGVSAGGGELRLTTRSSARSAEWHGIVGVTALALTDDPDANRTAAVGAGIVLLGVKPVGIGELAEEIAGSLAPGAIVVSVAAGVSTAAIERRLPAGTAVVRAMPNTPAAIGLGVTGLSAGSSVSDEQLDLVRHLFEQVGTVVVVPESQIDALSTISGSGPAYVFYLVEQLEAAAVARGLDPADAAALTRGTFAGAMALLAQSDVPPSELRRRVTSPNGTTERAIAVFDERGLPDAFDAATAAALARAQELGAQLS